MEAPKVIISDLKGGGIKEVTTLWVMEGVSFEIDPEKYIDVRIFGENRLRREIGRGPAPKKLICSAIDTHSRNNVLIKKIFGLMENHRVVWSIIRQIWFFRNTKSKFQHFFIQLTDIVTPFKTDLFDSTIHDIYLSYEFNQRCLTLFQFIEHTKTNSSYRRYHKTILCQLLLVAFYLQSRKIEHRDLSPWNVVLRHNFKLKVDTFGSCTTESRTTSNLKEKVDALILKDNLKALWYRPPEALLSSSSFNGGGTYDIWSIGCLFGEILYQKPLFDWDLEDIIGDSENIEAQTQLDAIANILGDPNPEDLDFIKDDDNEVATSFKASVLKKSEDGLNIPPLPFGELIEGADPLALDLLKRMLMYNPKERIRAEDALKHEYVREFLDRDPLLQRWLADIKEDGKPKLEDDDDDEEQEKVDDYDFIRKRLLREKFMFYNPRIFPLS